MSCPDPAYRWPSAAHVRPSEHPCEVVPGSGRSSHSTCYDPQAEERAAGRRGESSVHVRKSCENGAGAALDWVVRWTGRVLDAGRTDPLSRKLEQQRCCQLSGAHFAGRTEVRRGSLSSRERSQNGGLAKAASTKACGRGAPLLVSWALLALAIAVFLPGLSQGAVTRLEIARQPRGALERQALLQQPRINLFDGEALAAEEVAVSVECAEAADGSFWGTRAVIARQGVANFTDLVFNVQGENYVLTFSVDEVTVDSEALVVQPGLSTLEYVQPQKARPPVVHVHRNVAGQPLVACPIVETCFNVSIFCSNPSDPDAVDAARYHNLSYISCAGENSTLSALAGQGYIECLEAADCSDPVRLKSLAMRVANTEQGAVVQSKHPVTVETITVSGGVGAELTGEIVEGSCCQLPTCNVLHQACCDCNRPECALCMLPLRGEVIFDSLRINRVGLYQVKYSTSEYQYNSAGGAEVSFASAAAEHLIEIVAGPAATFKILQYPVVMEVTSDGGAVLDPPPRFEFADAMGNPTVRPQPGTVLAMLCRDRNASGIDLEYSDAIPRDLEPCACDDAACTRADSTLSGGEVKSAQTLDGELIRLYESEPLVFPGLVVSTAGKDLRVLLRWYVGGALVEGISAKTPVFIINPGQPHHLSVGNQPSRMAGCVRCPVGQHLAGEPLSATVFVYDIFGNVLTHCVGGELCEASSGAPINVIAIDAATGENATGSLFQENEGGQVSADTSEGRALFTGVRLRHSRRTYILRFEGVGSTVDSEPFFLVSGAPARLRAGASGAARDLLIFGTDLEVFGPDTEIEVLDASGNLADSDCYTNCSGTLEGLCTNVSAACAPAIGVQVSEQATLAGHLQRTAQRGVASFDDLRVAVAETSQCDCDGSQCPPCSTCYSRLPIPRHALTFTISPHAVEVVRTAFAGIAPLSVGLALQNRVQRIQILVQPSEVPAREAFLSPIRVQARDCAGATVVNTTAPVTVSIGSNAGGGNLFGRRTVPLAGGSSTFSDVSLSVFGDGYTLTFQYGGRAAVQQVESVAFKVQKPAARLVFVDLSDPGLRQPWHVAGTMMNGTYDKPPQIEILDEDGTRVDSRSSVAVLIAVDPWRRLVGGRELWAQQYAGPSVLGGTTVVIAEGGFVTFGDLSIDKATLHQENVAGKFVLRFLLNEITLDSTPFDVHPEPVMDGLFVFTQPVRSVAGVKLVVKPRIFVVDRFNNRINIKDVPYKEPREFMEATLVGGPASAQLIQDDYQGCKTACLQNPQEPEALICNQQTVECGLLKQKLLNTKAEATFHTLRVDTAFGQYRLQFTYSGLTTVSEPFQVDNTLPKYPVMIVSPSGPQSADFPFSVQPRLTVRDKFGNSVVVDSIADRRVTVKLLPKGGLGPVAPPLTPVPGQAPKSICRVDPRPFRGSLSIPVDLATGEGTFTDLQVVQVMQDYRMQFTMTSSQGLLTTISDVFFVVPGKTTGICNMSLPAGCSVLGPCSFEGEMVCTDAYGNVQPTCSTCFGPKNRQKCGFSPFNIPSSFTDIDCPGSICVKLIPEAAPPGSILSSRALNNGKDCSKTFCMVSVAPGSATFTDLTLDKAGTTFKLRFYTQVVYPYTQTTHVWTYDSPPFNVTPPAPRVDRAFFTPDMAQVHVHFDQQTDTKGELRGPALCQRELDPAFITTLGADPYCTWESRQVLALSIGEGGYINTSTPVQIAADSNITSSVVVGGVGGVGGVQMTSLPATTVPDRIVFGSPVGTVHPETTAPPPVPSVLVLGPAEINACDRVSAVGRQALGSAARPFVETRWDIDLANSTLERGILLSRGDTLGFVRKEIHLSSVLAYDVNVLTVTLRPLSPIPSGTNVTITGLLGHFEYLVGCSGDPIPSAPSEPCFASATPAMCVNVPLYGAGSRIFKNATTADGVRPTAQWFMSAAGSELHLSIAENEYLSDVVETIFSLRLLNPIRPVANPLATVQIEMNCAGCRCRDASCVERDAVDVQVQSMEMDCTRIECARATFQMVEELPTITSATASESSAVSGVTNTISLVLTMDKKLPPDARVTISGLGASVPDGRVCVSGSAANHFACSICDFDDGGGTPAPARSASATAAGGALMVNMRNGSTLEANEPLRLSFRATNPPVAARAACVSADLGCPSTTQLRVKLSIPSFRDLGDPTRTHTEGPEVCPRPSRLNPSARRR